MLEAISDAEFWIWGSNFGLQRSMNDMNILDSSNIVQKIIEGDFVPEFEYIVNNRSRKLPYCPVGGIWWGPEKEVSGISQEWGCKKDHTKNFCTFHKTFLPSRSSP